jgi:hypothetical protein
MPASKTPQIRVLRNKRQRVGGMKSPNKLLPLPGLSFSFVRTTHDVMCIAILRRNSVADYIRFF